MTQAVLSTPDSGELESRRLCVRTVVDDALSSLVSIYEPEVNVCIARRQLSFSLGRALPGPEGLTSRGLASEGLVGLVADEELSSDLAFVAELLRDLTGADDVGVRVCHSTSPMCARLHVDHIPLRLVCTYVGPGTEWVDQSGGEGWFDCGTTERRGRLRRAEPGDIVLLKGEGWVGNEGCGAAHRSPAHREPRLVASFDPLWLKPSRS